MRFSILGIFVIYLLGNALLLQAQDIPNTRVYAFEMVRQDNSYRFTNPLHLTGFNPNGYNNQPRFVDNQKLFLTVQFPDESQTDIYELDFSKKSLTRITRTVEGEYSPMKIPYSPHFSAVRVETDAAKTQRLWKFPMNKGNYGQPVFDDIRGVGYHEWLTPEKVALFIVDTPSKLMIANQQTGSAVELLQNIGRCFQKVGNDNLAFVQKVTADDWYIKEMDSYTYRFKDIVRTLPNQEDFLYLPDGTYLMGNGSKLYKFNKKLDADWQEIADFEYYGIKNITRLATSGDGTIVIVSNFLTK